MASPDMLGNFIKETMEQYPAENYALIIGDHGAGWNGVIEDWSHFGWMSTPKIRKGIELGLANDNGEINKKLDIIGFDACLLASSEVAHELKHLGTFMVGSEDSEGGDGWPYTPLLSEKKLQSIDRDLGNRLNISSREMAERMVRGVEIDPENLTTMSAIDLSKIEKLTREIDSLAKGILSTRESNENIINIIKKTTSWNGYKDLYHFADMLSSDEAIKDEALKREAGIVRDAVKDAVIAEQHVPDYPNAHGLNIELPRHAPISNVYQELMFAKETKWDEAMAKIHTKPTAPGGFSQAPQK
jgi:hypothetical protein